MSPRPSPSPAAPTVFPISVNGNCISSCSVQKHWHHPQLLMFADNHSALPLKCIQHLTASHCPGPDEPPQASATVSSRVSLPPSLAPLNQGSTNFFLKSQRVNISGSVGQMVSVATTQLYHCRKQTTTDNMHLNECACVPIEVELQTLKFELCIIFTCHETLSFFLFSSKPLKNVKPRLALQPVQKQAGGWSLACGCLGLEYFLSSPI